MRVSGLTYTLEGLQPSHRDVSDQRPLRRRDSRRTHQRRPGHHERGLDGTCMNAPFVELLLSVSEPAWHWMGEGK